VQGGSSAGGEFKSCQLIRPLPHLRRIQTSSAVGDKGSKSLVCYCKISNNRNRGNGHHENKVQEKKGRAAADAVCDRCVICTHLFPWITTAERPGTREGRGPLAG
jgi:hypothetical protein